MANAQIATSLTAVNSLLGYQAISLTNFVASAESLIAAGSKVEVGGAFFTFSGNETPQASTWTIVGTGNTAYITLTPSGSAGSQVLTAMYAATAPTFSTSKQGWYQSAASIVRYIGGVYKAGTSQYEGAFLLDTRQRRVTQLESITIEIGDWDMDADQGVQIVPPVDHRTIRFINGFFRNDDDTVRYPLPYVTNTTASTVVVSSLDNDKIQLARIDGGFFDSANFDSTSYNRGWLNIWYAG